MSETHRVLLRSLSYTRAYLDRLVREREGGIGSGD